MPTSLRALKVLPLAVMALGALGGCVVGEYTPRPVVVAAPPPPPTVVVAPAPVIVVEPGYYYSPGYCYGCWHGWYGGRYGWHRWR